MSKTTTRYPTQPASGSSPLSEIVETSSNAGESSRAFAARHLDAWETRMGTKPLWIASHGGINGAILHDATIAGEVRRIQVWHKKGELATAWAERSVHAVARWSLSNPADV